MRSLAQTKYVAVSTLGATGLFVILAGIGLLIAMNMDYALARYPGSRSVGEARFDLSAIGDGQVGEASAYRTSDDLTTVWRWYRSRFYLEPRKRDEISAWPPCATMV